MMKYNLKNRPRKALSGETFKALNDWFVGFEKELREWYKQCTKDGVVEHAPVYILIQEILGEP